MGAYHNHLIKSVFSEVSGNCAESDIYDAEIVYIIVINPRKQIYLLYFTSLKLLNEPRLPALEF